MPNVEFSWQRHDFGKCFIYKQGMTLQQCILNIANKDTKQIRFKLFLKILIPPKPPFYQVVLLDFLCLMKHIPAYVFKNSLYFLASFARINQRPN